MKLLHYNSLIPFEKKISLAFAVFYKFFCEFVTSGCDASKNSGSCCSFNYPCDVGEGDCDNDKDCLGDLVCGNNNCKSFDSAWSNKCFDCCTIKTGAHEVTNNEDDDDIN